MHDSRTQQQQVIKNYLWVWLVSHYVTKKNLGLLKKIKKNKKLFEIITAIEG